LHKNAFGGLDPLKSYSAPQNHLAVERGRGEARRRKGLEIGRGRSGRKDRT